MQIFLVTPVFIAFLGLAAFGGLPRLLMLTIAMLPFGMLAVVNLPAVGGLSILASNLAAATMVGFGLLLILTRLLRSRPINIEPATFALAIFAIYALISAVLLVRLFAGEIMVFSLARGAQTVQVETAFSMGKVWLAPSTTNLSQTFYIVVGASFFVAALHVLRHKGSGFGERCLVIAGGFNIVLGLLDLAALDALLAPVRTANYALLNFHIVSGMPRVIGGFPEASSYGTFSVALFAYFAMACLREYRPLFLWLAIGNGLFGFLSLSATGLIPLGVVVPIIALLLLARLRRGLTPLGVVAGTSVVLSVALMVSYTLAFSDVADTLGAAINRLIFEKADSSSGIERAAWAMGGLEAFRESWGLGVGVGSMRSNGLAFAVLGSMGLVGLLSLGAFIVLAFGPSARPLEREQKRILASSRLAAAAVLISMLLASTSPDPGLLLLFLAALALATKRQSEAPQPAFVGPHALAPSLRPVLSSDRHR